MKITKAQLRKIVKEELNATLKEADGTKTYKLLLYDGQYDHEIEVKGATSVEVESGEYHQAMVIDGKIKVDFLWQDSLKIVG